MSAYATDRLRFFRSKKLDDSEKSTISHIEQFGHEVILIEPDVATQGWAFTVGLYDTAAKPEVIVIGLKKEVAQYLLNEAADRLRAGDDLAIGRHQGFLEGIEVEFRPVERKWLKQVMGWATWYNNSDEFPVLQAIYPDRENRFPEETGFDTNFSQPLLQTDSPMGVLEEDFWAASDPESSLFDWKFPDPPHTRVFLSETVNKGTEPVTYVSHDLEDGAWQFLGDSMSDGGGPVISCFHHPIDRDPSLKELADLPLGWYAERETPSSQWIRRRSEPEEEQEED